MLNKMRRGNPDYRALKWEHWIVLFNSTTFSLITGINEECLFEKISSTWNRALSVSARILRCSAVNRAERYTFIAKSYEEIPIVYSTLNRKTHGILRTYSCSSECSIFTWFISEDGTLSEICTRFSIDRWIQWISCL